MDEYVGGTSSNYTTRDESLVQGLEALTMLKEDSAKLAAKDLHELLRCWENYHRIWAAEVHLRHILFRKETRYPGYYYRSDFPELDDENWKYFVNSRFDAAANEWKLTKKPYSQVVS
jgi:adenylylsulfate reductase subunit A